MLIPSVREKVSFLAFVSPYTLVLWQGLGIVHRAACEQTTVTMAPSQDLSLRDQAVRATI